MTKRNRTGRMAAAVLAGGLIAVSLAGCSVAGYDIVFDTSFSDDDTVFTINGKKCGATEARLYLCNYRNLYGRAYGVDLWQYDFNEDLEAYIRRVTIDELSRIYCMEQIAGQRGISLDDQEKQKAAQAAEQYYRSLSDEERDYIHADQKKLEEFYIRYGTAVKLYETMTGGETEEVSDDEARVVRIRQICTADRIKADKAQKKISAKADFAAVADSVNEEEKTELTVARGQMEKALENIIFELDNEQVSSLVEAGGKYYIFQCVNKYEKELTEANKQIILSERREKEFNDAYGEFVDSAEKSLSEEGWRTVTMPDEQIRTDQFFSLYE